MVAACEFLGPVSDEDKARLLKSVDLYVAPNTGGESFGIILIEAMSAGAPVLASDLPAFVRVLDGGSAGATFVNEDPRDLARRLLELLGDGLRTTALAAARAEAGRRLRLVGGRGRRHGGLRDGHRRRRTGPAGGRQHLRWTRLLRSGRAPLG